jgi:linoleoyl-CoA desaturase
MGSKLSFTAPEEGDYHYRQLQKLVRHRLKSVPERLLLISRIRALSFVALYLLLYGLALLNINRAALFYCCYMSMGFALVFIFLNVIHEALHGNLFANKKLNHLSLYFLDIMGANSYIFKKRHSILHHNFPNIAGWDSDTEQAFLIRVFPHRKQKWIHRIQHWSFILIYPSYLVNWLFVRDFKDYFVKAQVVRQVCKRIPAREYIKLFLFKSLFFFYTICIPVLLGASVQQAVTALLSMLVMAGIFSLMVLLTPHVNIKNEFPLPDNNNKITSGWLLHQMNTTNDVSSSNWVTRNLMANFNFHLAHHLFPHISYAYTPQVTEVIKDYASRNHLKYRSYSFRKALKYHYQLLKENASAVELLEEDM